MPKIEELRYFRYRFIFEPNGDLNKEWVLTVFLDKKTLDLVQPVREKENMPEWTNLSFSKCRNCPLSESEYKYCPVARSLVDVVEFFSDLPSFHEARVVVETERRTVTADTTVQDGLRSLMGLIMPTSGCPILGSFKPMAFLHSPFSDIDETTFRAVSTHLLGQYFNQRFGGTANFDLSSLAETYNTAHKVNVDFLGRLRAASKNDANLNSLVSLDIFTMSVPRSIDSQLNKFLPFFLPAEDPDDGGSCKK